MNEKLEMLRKVRDYYRGPYSLELCGSEGNWIGVRGVLDSGADVTVGNLQTHAGGKKIISGDNIHSKALKIRDANSRVLRNRRSCSSHNKIVSSV